MNDAALPLVVDHPGAAQDMQMIGQRGPWQAGGGGQLTYRHSIYAGLDEQTEKGQAMVLGQRIEAGQCVI